MRSFDFSTSQVESPKSTVLADGVQGVASSNPAVPTSQFNGLAHEGLTRSCFRERRQTEGKPADPFGTERAVHAA